MQSENSLAERPFFLQEICDHDGVVRENLHYMIRFAALLSFHYALLGSLETVFLISSYEKNLSPASGRPGNMKR